MSGIIDPDRKPRPMREIAARSKAAFAVVLSLVILVGGGWFVVDQVSGKVSELGLAPDYEGPPKNDVVVTVPSGATLTDIGDVLVEKDVVKSAKAFSNAVKEHPEQVSIQAGTYRLKQQMPARDALKALLDPKSLLRDFVTVPEGLRLSAQIDTISKATKIPKDQLNKAVKSKNLGLPDYADGNAEGFLFPNTYEYSEETSAEELVKQMVEQYNSVTSSLDFEGRAESLEFTPLELLTIASIVEREVRRPEDQAKVARVIVNRLAQDQALQMDSTVHYAVNKSDVVTTTDEDRKNRSPYNTYVHKGLPPGPISAPGRAALEAASSPEAGDWMFFVTVNLETGETRFAKTYDEHQANVALFQKWCQENPGKGC
ncbi:endolytic transglycosylase MltG [Propionibacteriaceae bacterium Y1685]|uniref:endolytic transglycosylase MltG n=1 Tax=Microlunatus sp. Y1700 TaxID=3418487 RepID=UPI003B7B8EE2